MALSQRDAGARNGLFVFLIFVALVLVGWLAVWPAYQDVGKTESELRATEQQRAERVKTVEDVKALVNAYTAKKLQLTALDQALPQAPAVPQLLSDVEVISRQSAMKIDSFKVTDAPTTDNRPTTPAPKPAGEQLFKAPELVRLRIALGVTGGVDHFPLLLDLLQRNGRLFDIQTIGVEGSGQGSQGQSKDAGNGKFNVTMTSYYLKSN